MSTEDKKTLTPQILALYLGCEMQWEIEGAQPASAKLQIVNLDGFVTLNLHGQRIGKLGSELKPILRPLSSITEKETIELVKTRSEVYKHSELVGATGYSLVFTAEYESSVRRRTHEIAWHKMDASEFLYLLSKGFDLFGLIDSGLAITQPK